MKTLKEEIIESLERPRCISDIVKITKSTRDAVRRCMVKLVEAGIVEASETYPNYYYLPRHDRKEAILFIENTIKKRFKNRRRGMPPKPKRKTHSFMFSDEEIARLDIIKERLGMAHRAEALRYCVKRIFDKRFKEEEEE